MAEFWFDFASTYSYIGAERVEGLCAKASVPLSWRPFLLGPIFTAQQGLKDSPFNANPARGQYMWKDVARQCRKYGLPFQRPATFPQRSILAARVACVGLTAEWVGDFIRGAFRAEFAEGHDLGSEAVLARVLTNVGADASVVLARAVTEQVKAQLRTLTDEALRRGIFGAPNLFVGDELFFGQDRLEDAVAFAAAEGRR